MFCKYCGIELDEDAAFCPNCDSFKGASPVPSCKTHTCYLCGATMPRENPYCTECGQPNPLSAPMRNTSMMERAAKRRKNRLSIVLASISLFLVLALLTCWLTNCFGFYGPATIIMKGAEKTFRGGNFTVQLATHSKQDGQTKSTDMTLKIDIDIENEELTVLGVNQDDLITFFIYDGYFVYSPLLFSVTDSDRYYAYNISKHLDKFFETAQNPEDFDFDALLDLIDEDWEEAVYPDKFKDAALQLFRNLNTNSWLKEHTGYSKAHTDGVRVYSFDPDLFDFSTTVVEGFEDSFRDKEQYENMVDSLMNSRKALRKTNVELSFGIAKGRLAALHYAQETEDAAQSIALQFHNIGSTIIDADLAALLDVAHIFGSK